MVNYKDIPGYEGRYQISENGQVWSIVSNRIIPPKTNKYGYHKIRLSNRGVHKFYFVHRLVLLTYQGLCSCLLQVNHIDANPLNNHISNLEWCTPKENAQHAVKLGRYIPPKGSKNGMSKLTEEIVLEIRKLL